MSSYPSSFQSKGSQRTDQMYQGSGYKRDYDFNRSTTYPSGSQQQQFIKCADFISPSTGSGKSSYKDRHSSGGRNADDQFQTVEHHSSATKGKGTVKSHFGQSRTQRTNAFSAKNQRRQGQQTTMNQKEVPVDVTEPGHFLELWNFPVLLKKTGIIPTSDNIMLLGEVGSVGTYNESCDKANNRKPLVLKDASPLPIESTTSDDTFLMDLALHSPLGRPGVYFATDEILSVLMACPRSYFTWRLYITVLPNGAMIIDKKDAHVGETDDYNLSDTKESIQNASILDQTTVNENMSDPPKQDTPLSAYGVPGVVGQQFTITDEAALVTSKYLSQAVVPGKQLVTVRKPFDLKGLNEFLEEDQGDDEEETEEAPKPAAPKEETPITLTAPAVVPGHPPFIYRYFAVRLTDSITLIYRSKVDAVMKTPPNMMPTTRSSDAEGEGEELSDPVYPRESTYPYDSAPVTSSGPRISPYQYTDPTAANGTSAVYTSLCCFHEIDPRRDPWQSRFDATEGSIINTETKNNAFKLARWLIRAHLGHVDVVKLGFVTRQVLRTQNIPPMMPGAAGAGMAGSLFAPQANKAIPGLGMYPAGTSASTLAMYSGFLPSNPRSSRPGSPTPSLSSVVTTATGLTAATTFTAATGGSTAGSTSSSNASPIHNHQLRASLRHYLLATRAFSVADLARYGNLEFGTNWETLRILFDYLYRIHLQQKAYSVYLDKNTDADGDTEGVARVPEGVDAHLLEIGTLHRTPDDTNIRYIFVKDPTKQSLRLYSENIADRQKEEEGRKQSREVELFGDCATTWKRVYPDTEEAKADSGAAEAEPTPDSQPIDEDLRKKLGGLMRAYLSEPIDPSIDTSSPSWDRTRIGNNFVMIDEDLDIAPESSQDENLMLVAGLTAALPAQAEDFNQNAAEPPESGALVERADDARAEGAEEGM